jgi:hypothetical protein
MSDLISFDWFVLFLRIAILALLYLFLWQLVRVMLRELIVAGRRADNHPAIRRTPGRMIVVDPADSTLDVGSAFQITHQAIIGRQPHCTVRIDEPYVSGEHAEITWQDGQWIVRDLDSTNGTYVNGQVVTGSTDIQPGDIVQFGRVKLEFVP